MEYGFTLRPTKQKKKYCWTASGDDPIAPSLEVKQKDDYASTRSTTFEGILSVHPCPAMGFNLYSLRVFRSGATENEKQVTGDRERSSRRLCTP